jgi:hypothetical protein
MFSNLLEYSNLRLFQAVEANSSHDLMKATYKILRLSKVRKLLIRNEWAIKVSETEKINNSNNSNNLTFYLFTWGNVVA